MAGIPRYDDGSWRPAGPTARSWVQRVILSVGVLGALGCLAASAFVYRQQEQLESISRTEVETATVVEGEPQNWLIVGSDSRDVIDKDDPNAGAFLRGETGGRRTDTIMIVRVDPVGEVIDILSLPRDLWVTIARSDDKARINAAYGYEDGQQRLIDTISEFLNIEVHRFVEINFETFKGIVDAVGGVPMFFEHAIRDDRAGLFLTELGCVKLNGDQALAYARSRHLDVMNDKGRWVSDPSSDYGRISRQQFFVKLMLKRAAGSATNPRALDSMIGVARQHVQLDDDIDVGEVADMAKKFGSFEGDSVRSHSLPTNEVKKGDADVLELKLTDAEPILNIFRGLTEHDRDPRTVAFTVRNASGTTGRGHQVADAFREMSYQPRVGEDVVAQPRTLIRFGFGGQDPAAQLARHLTAGADLQSDETLGPDEVVLTIGQDFTTVMRRPRPWEPPTFLPSAEAMGAVTTTAPSTTTTRKGQATKSSSTTTSSVASTTTTTEPPGVIPGHPPEGVTCE